MSIDLSATNLWLGILAASVLVQTVLLSILALWAYRAASRASVALDRAALALEPLVKRGATCLDDLHAISGVAQRTEATLRETTDSVRSATHRLGHGVELARALVVHRLWPVTGLVRGLSAAVGVFVAARRRRDARRREDENAEAQFLYEGGAQPARDPRPARIART